MKEQQLQKLYKAERIIRLWDKETIAGLEAYLELEKIFAQRPEAPAQTSCDNSSGLPIAAPSCVRTERTYTAAQFKKAFFAVVDKIGACYRNDDFFWRSLIAALDPPKPKTPELPNAVKDLLWRNDGSGDDFHGHNQGVIEAYNIGRAELAKEGK